MKKTFYKIFNTIFNDVLVNIYIICTSIIIEIFIYLKLFKYTKTFNLEDTLSIIFIYLFSLFFIANYTMIKLIKNYIVEFNKYTILAVVFYAYAIISLMFILNMQNEFIDGNYFDTRYSLIISFYFSYISWVWIAYLNFCIRTLNSINAKYSIFIVTTVKSILISIVAWLAVYKNEGTTTIDYSINVLISYISLSYPILDMYKYVRLKLDKYIKENIIIIK